MRILLVIPFSLLCVFCSSVPQDVTTISYPIRTEPTSITTTSFGSPPVVEEQPEYPGKTIDQIFPILSERFFSEGEAARAKALIPALGFDVEVNAFAPVSLMQGHRRLLRFKVEP